MNAVIYARYSSHAQSEQSIEGQLRVCREYAERMELNVIDTYIDRALTGTTANRPGFQKMIKDSKKRQFDYVIVYKLDRFARDRYDSAVYKNELKKNGAKLLSAMENISDAPEGVILEAVIEAMAEYYSLDLAQKVKRGMHETLEKKLWTGGIPPFGLKVEDKKLLIDEKNGPHAKWIFEQLAEGIPKEEIVSALNARGIRNQTGRRFTLSSIDKLPRNKKYIGIHVYGGQEYPDYCPALIDQETFDKVQRRLDDNRHAPRHAAAREKYILYGKAYCGYCDTNLISDVGTGGNKERYSYYACGKRKRFNQCHKKTEPKEALERYIVEQTLCHVLAPGKINAIAREVVRQYEKEYDNSNIKAVQRAIKKIEIEIDDIVDKIVESSSRTVQEKLEAKIQSLEVQKDDLVVELAKLEIATATRITVEDVQKWLRSFLNGDVDDPDFRERVIDTLVNAVYVYDDKIVIYYNSKSGQNIKKSEQISGADHRSALERSNLFNFGGEKAVKFEHMLYAKGCFGFIFNRNKK